MKIASSFVLRVSSQTFLPCTALTYSHIVHALLNIFAFCKATFYVAAVFIIAGNNKEWEGWSNPSFTQTVLHQDTVFNQRPLGSEVSGAPLPYSTASNTFGISQQQSATGQRSALLRVQSAPWNAAVLLQRAFSFMTALHPLFKTACQRGIASWKPGIVRRNNTDSYNVQAVWNNKIIKDVGEPWGVGNREGSTSSHLLKSERVFAENISITSVRLLYFSALTFTEITVRPVGLKFRSRHLLSSHKNNLLWCRALHACSVQSLSKILFIICYKVTQIQLHKKAGVFSSLKSKLTRS